VAKTPKVKTPEGVVKVNDTLMAEALTGKRPPVSSDLRARKNDAAKRPKRPPTATAAKEQMYSVEDAADYLALSEARVRGLMRKGLLKYERVQLATDEGKRPRTAVRIRKSVLDILKTERKAKDQSAEERKKGKLNRTPRASKPKQYIAVLTITEFRQLVGLGYQPVPRFGGIGAPDDSHQATQAA
jgi:hypothetical protein